MAKTHSQTCERREGTKTYPSDFSALLVADITIDLLLGEASCGVRSIEQSPAAMGGESVAPLLRFARPRPKYESAIRGWPIVKVRCVTLKSLGSWLTGVSQVDSADLADGALRMPHIVRPKDPRAVASPRPPCALPWAQLSLSAMLRERSRPPKHACSR
jgi:hypothetical protein